MFKTLLLTLLATALIWGVILLSLSIACPGGKALINLGYPPGYTLILGNEEHEHGAILQLQNGIHTLHFRKGKGEYSSTIRVSGGGEIYRTLDESEIHPVVEVKYVPGS